MYMQFFFLQDPDIYLALQTQEAELRKELQRKEVEVCKLQEELEKFQSSLTPQVSNQASHGGIKDDFLEFSRSLFLTSSSLGSIVLRCPLECPVISIQFGYKIKYMLVEERQAGRMTMTAL